MSIHSSWRGEVRVDLQHTWTRRIHPNRSPSAKYGESVHPVDLSRSLIVWARVRTMSELPPMDS